MLTIKSFNDLTNVELYKIIQLRTEIFVVEQDCVYQDLDDKDFDAVHIFLSSNNNIDAYLRVIEIDELKQSATIGRVVVAKKRLGLGTRILKETFAYLKTNTNIHSINIKAQEYAEEFYTQVGFIRVSDVYSLDNIPHINMTIKIK